MREQNILPAQQFCDNPACNHNEMQIRNDNTRVDGQRWRCSRCERSKSIRVDSIFENMRMPLVLLYRIIFVDFFNNTSIVKLVQEYQVHESVIRKIFRGIKLLISDFLQFENTLFDYGTLPFLEHDHANNIDYNSPAVEIDESLATHLMRGPGNIFEN